VKFYMAENLYKLGETARANDILDKSGDYINKELNYLADISQSKGLTGSQNIQTGLYYLDRMIKTSKAAGQDKLSDKLQKTFNTLEGRLSMFFPQQGPQQ
jgi:hypothetical protein